MASDTQLYLGNILTVHAIHHICHVQNVRPSIQVCDRESWQSWMVLKPVQLLRTSQPLSFEDKERLDGLHLIHLTSWSSSIHPNRLVKRSEQSERERNIRQ